jgi:hypothetical protein
MAQHDVGLLVPKEERRTNDSSTSSRRFTCGGMDARETDKAGKPGIE